MFTVKVRPLVAAKLTKELGDLSQEEHQLALRLRSLADPYVPARSGAMAAGATVRDNVLSYSSRQAFPLYDGVRGGKKISFSGDVHPQAQSYWVWAAKKDHTEELRGYAAELLRKKLGAK